MPPPNPVSQIVETGLPINALMFLAEGLFLVYMHGLVRLDFADNDHGQRDGQQWCDTWLIAASNGHQFTETREKNKTRSPDTVPTDLHRKWRQLILFPFPLSCDADEWMDRETSGGICRKLTSLLVAFDPVLEMDSVAEINSNILYSVFHQQSKKALTLNISV